MDLGISGKFALVCASSRGLGLATAESLAAEGVHVLLCARDGDLVEGHSKRIAQTYDVRAQGFAIDLSQPDELAAAFREVHEFTGGDGASILVNNVGGPGPSSATDTSCEAFQRGFQQIFLSSTLLSQGLLPAMMRQGFGRIITITSLSVLEPIDHLVVSTAMRAAVTTYHKTLAKEVAARGVTVNTVMPGIIHTKRIEDLRRAKAQRLGTSFEEEMAKTIAEIPVGRLGKPAELAALITFLASKQASYITGQNHAVDGGQQKSW